MPSEEIRQMVDDDARQNGDGKAAAEAKLKLSPIEVTHPESVEPDRIRLLKAPPWKLRLTIDGDRSYLRVKVVRAAPLSHPDRYICFLDAKDEVICMVDSLQSLEEEYRPLAEEDLDRRYLTARVERVHAIQMEFGVSYWEVDTDRGRREFVAKDVAENVQWMGDHRLLILDVDGNRFEVEDLGALDKRSRSLMDLVL